MSTKTLLRQHPSVRDDIADLVTRRPLPGRGVEQIDPFLFLNHHGPQVYPPRNRGLPFGPHPHRGFETVTFILEGDLAHRDSGGHESVIHAGGVQWMTAGSGLVHAEVSPQDFMDRGGPLEILQLWVNLPPALKMTPPRYIGVQRDGIPAIDVDGVRVNLISGSFRGHRGPIDSLTGIVMTTLQMPVASAITLEGLAGRNVFLYVVRGTVQAAGSEIAEHSLGEFDLEGSTLELRASTDAVLLFGHARPIGAPVVSHGPFVMNTRAEIEQAVRDYHAGKFGPLG